MLGFPPFGVSQIRIYLYPQEVDMRKSFDGLHAIIQNEFQKDVRSGDMFLFLNRRLDRLKLLGWDRDGLMIFYKRLEKGTFQRPLSQPNSTHVELDAAELAALLTGIELRSVQRRRRYTPPSREASSSVASAAT